MSEQDNVRLVREALDAWNKHDAGRYAALLDETHLIESDTIPAPMAGREAAQRFKHIYVSAFPDLRIDNEQLLGSGDFVVARWTATGTHRGELMGIAPSNRRATTHGCTVYEVRNGRITHEWIHWDTGHLLRQLGVLPTA
jgi:steroid delta-isomerase-like uncharacterized protein